MTMLDDLDDFFPEVLGVQPGYLDYRGDFIASGQMSWLHAHIEGSNRLVRDSRGREVVSSVNVIVQGVYNLTVERHRYWLPSRFIPSGNLLAITIVRESDEGGPLYEEVYLP